MPQSIDLLIYVEDPGAANYIAPLMERFLLEKWQVQLFVGGTAGSYLRGRSLAPAPIPPNLNPRELLITFAPRLLVVGTAENRDTLGLLLVSAARELGIKSLGVVDAPSNAAERFRGRSDRPLTHVPDYLLVPDEATRQAYIALGYSSTQAVVCGHPYYDTVRQTRIHLDSVGRSVLRASIFPEVPTRQPIVVFVAEVSRGLKDEQYRRSAEYTLIGDGKQNKRTEIVLEEFLRGSDRLIPHPYRVLRLHPKNTRQELAFYLERFDCISEGGSPLELIYTADLVVGMTSSLLLEATLLGRPTVAILPRSSEKEWCAVTASGTIPVLTRRAEIVPTLTRLLSSDNLEKEAIGLPQNCCDRTINWLKQRLSSLVSAPFPIVYG
ncbi:MULTISPECIES: hypothetical protein [Spirulina sp. CCY15215]|uniref:hypothetical protein n=1 Tax=Spirulina sp. CCY15215 TaxID=2767591 RepID=UPI001950CA83